MATVLNSDDIVSQVTQKSGPIEMREGDWKACQHFFNRYEGSKTLIEEYGSFVAYKRACAMAYLGKRAQFHGGVCNGSHPHVITPKFVADLDAANRAVRYQRYPWLGKMMNLLNEIKCIQDEISANSNVIVLVPAVK